MRSIFAKHLSLFKTCFKDKWMLNWKQVINSQLKMLNFCNIFQIWVCWAGVYCDVEQLVGLKPLWKHHFHFLDANLPVCFSKGCLVNYEILKSSSMKEQGWIFVKWYLPLRISSVCAVCVSLGSCAVRAGHADRGGHRLRGVRHRSPADRSALVHLLTHRYGQGRACRALWATAQGGEGRGPPLLILGFLFSCSLSLIRSFPAAPPVSLCCVSAEWYPPFPKGRCYVLWFKHRSWKLTWDMSKTEYFWLVYYR